MYRRTIQGKQEFVWRPKTRWRKNIIRLVVVGFAMAAFVWGALLPINTVTIRRAVMTEPASQTAAENSVSQAISPQTRGRLDERPNVVKTSQAIAKARQPSTWIIRAQ